MRAMILAAVLFASVAFAGEYQVSVGTTVVVCVSENTNRMSVTIKADDDNSGKIHIRHSDPNVSTGTGFELGASQSYTYDAGQSPKGPIHCVGSAASQTAHIEETFR